MLRRESSLEPGLSWKRPNLPRPVVRKWQATENLVSPTCRNTTWSAVIERSEDESGKMSFPINHGILHFVGFDVLPPFVAWAVARSTPEQRQEYLKCFEERLRKWQTTTPIAYHPLENYDDTLQLKPEFHP